MSISSISSSTPVQAAPKGPAVEAGEATRGGKDVSNDGDADDAGGSVALTTTPQPTTNTMGQQIGKNLNVTA